MDLQALYAKTDAAKEDMLQWWKQLVDRDCGTANKAGVDSVGRDIAAFLEDLPVRVRFETFEKAGNMLIAEYGDTTKPFVILTGHMDTVFKDGTAAERPFTIRDGKAYGPGVLDMKGGVTILLYAVKFLAEAGYDRYPIKIILAGDEEVGHQNSDAVAVYERESQGAVMAFNFETGFPDNSIVVQRKGVYQAVFEVFGKSAHAGNAPEKGRSAIREMAHKVLDIEALTDWEIGNNCNVGVIEGGTVANAVPDYAKIRVDVRFLTNKGLEIVKEGFQKIAEKTYIEGTRTVYTPVVEFSAMERLDETEALLNKANQIAEEEGFPAMKGIMVGGGSDSAYTTKLGIPTLCAMGVRGEWNHTPREWAEVDSLFERTKLLMALLCRL